MWAGEVHPYAAVEISATTVVALILTDGGRTSVIQHNISIAFEAPGALLGLCPPYCHFQYNTSWGTETPPGTSLQACFVAHGRRQRRLAGT